MNNTRVHVCLRVHLLRVEREGYESADSPPELSGSCLVQTFTLVHCPWMLPREGVSERASVDNEK